MAKIYNEVIIDMNPESSSYGETLYEDSYEYSGDIMLMQDTQKDFESKTYWVKVEENPNVWQKYIADQMVGGEGMKGYSKGSDAWVDRPANKTQTRFNSLAEFEAAYQAAKDASTDYGAASIGKNDFVDEQGNPLGVATVIENLVKKFPDKPRSEIEAQVRENAPKFQAVPEEEKQFAKEAMQRDVYGISKEARKVGAQARGVYGGTGASMRGAMTGTEDIAKGFEQAQQAYQQDLYGLEKGAERAYEADIAGFISGWRKGGRVPTKGETFLDVLTQLPDAGGS